MVNLSASGASRTESSGAAASSQARAFKPGTNRGFFYGFAQSGDGRGKASGTGIEFSEHREGIRPGGGGSQVADLSREFSPLSKGRQRAQLPNAGGNQCGIGLMSRGEPGRCRFAAAGLEFQIPQPELDVGNLLRPAGVARLRRIVREEFLQNGTGFLGLAALAPRRRYGDDVRDERGPPGPWARKRHRQRPGRVFARAKTGNVLTHLLKAGPALVNDREPAAFVEEEARRHRHPQMAVN